MRSVVRHPNGVSIDGKLYLRDEYFAADHITLREALALAVLALGALVYAAGVIIGIVWLVRRWF